jgi:hypothetical protein
VPVVAVVTVVMPPVMGLVQAVPAVGVVTPWPVPPVPVVTAAGASV